MSIKNPTLQITLIFFVLLLSISQLLAQTSQGVTHSGQKTGQPAFPLESYTELPNPIPTPSHLWNQLSQTSIGWGQTGIRYEKELPVRQNALAKQLRLQAWRGEKLSAQWVVSSPEKDLDLSVEIIDLKHNSSGDKISTEHIQTAFVRYVMTDELNKNGLGACGHRQAKDFDSTLVADAIDHLTSELSIEKNTTRPGWVSIEVPIHASPGVYTAALSIRDAGKTIARLPVSLEVGNRVLPNPDKWSYHLDLWQNPYASARYYQTPLWSPEHFKAMKKDFEGYAKAGGKSITATIIDRAWDGQTHDEFNSMVGWTKKLDGSWDFNFDVFDKWVSFMMQLGVTKQINAYSMIPWKLSFAYYDQASNTTKHLETSPGEPEYEQAWVAMLSEFASHLKQKGWFDKTYIAMDERPMEAMQETIKVIRKANKDFKISFAGGLHPELFDDIDDYCLSLSEDYPKGVIQQRAQSGKTTTFYTSCAEAHPNSFTFSAPDQTQWYAWYAASTGMDGYLRWAYNSWVLEPLLDSRFTTWAAGDTYFVYPGGRTSIRFEKMIQGIQAYEKINILKEEFQSQGNSIGLQKLQQALALFTKQELKESSASAVIKKAEQIINSL